MKKTMITVCVMILTTAYAIGARAGDDDWGNNGYYVQPQVNYYYPQSPAYNYYPQYSQPSTSTYYSPQSSYYGYGQGGNGGNYYGYNTGYRYGGYAYPSRYCRRGFDDDD